MINYHQDDGVDLLPLAKFAHNNTYHSSFSQIPFLQTMDDTLGSLWQ